MKRYHVMCDGAPGCGGWRVRCEDGADQFQIGDEQSTTPGAFAVVDIRLAVPLEVRPRRTWRHRVFDVLRGGEAVAVVRTSLRSGIRAEFVWEMPGPDMLEVRGDFADSNYRFIRGARTVALVTTLGEHELGFGLEVRSCEEQGVILATALAVRCLCAQAAADQSRSRSVIHAAVPFETGVRATG